MCVWVRVPAKQQTKQQQEGQQCVCRSWLKSINNQTTGRLTSAADQQPVPMPPTYHQVGGRHCKSIQVMWHKYHKTPDQVKAVTRWSQVKGLLLGERTTAGLSNVCWCFKRMVWRVTRRSYMLTRIYIRHVLCSPQLLSLEGVCVWPLNKVECMGGYDFTTGISINDL